MSQGPKLEALLMDHVTVCCRCLRVEGWHTCPQSVRSASSFVVCVRADMDVLWACAANVSVLSLALCL